MELGQKLDLQQNKVKPILHFSIFVPFIGFIICPFVGMIFWFQTRRVSLTTLYKKIRAIFENNILPLIFTQKSMELVGMCGEERWKREGDDMGVGEGRWHGALYRSVVVWQIWRCKSEQLKVFLVTNMGWRGVFTFLLAICSAMLDLADSYVVTGDTLDYVHVEGWSK